MNQHRPDFYQHYPNVNNQTPYRNTSTTNDYVQMPKIPHVQQEATPVTMTLEEHIAKLYEKIKETEEENRKLKEEIKKIKPITIENINYKIQDLNVQDLSGTLLIGLSALSDAENLKNLLSENESVTLNDFDTDEFENNIINNEENQNNDSNQ